MFGHVNDKMEAEVAEEPLEGKEQSVDVSADFVAFWRTRSGGCYSPAQCISAAVARTASRVGSPRVSAASATVVW